MEKENVAEVNSCLLTVPSITFDTYDNDNNIVNPFTCEESKKLVGSIKKSTTFISKIATRNNMYNPIQRKSLDKLSPMFANSRLRRSVAISSIPKPTQKVTKTKITFPCEWCKKSFELNKALTNHLIEYCQKIPCNEKKKLMNPVTSNPEQKRKSVFIIPGPKKSASTSTSTNKRPKMHSGVTITPKKTLFCTICAMKFQDVCSYAKHIITHKPS